MSALRAWRIYLGISVRELSAASGLSVPTIEFLDKGGFQLCQWTAAKVAGALKTVSVQNLLAAERLAAGCTPIGAKAHAGMEAESDRSKRGLFRTRPYSYVSKA